VFVKLSEVKHEARAHPVQAFPDSSVLASSQSSSRNTASTASSLSAMSTSYTISLRPSLTFVLVKDTNIVDNAETVYISSLALLKMLRHGRAGVPMEVMGLMLGEFVDDYTVRVVDVFAMPQSGTGVSVEAVDPVFQTKMMDMLRQTNRYLHTTH
jgi:26S proteasome regulatory subunit N11